MAIHCWKYTARAGALALLLCAAAIGAVAQNAAVGRPRGAEPSEVAFARVFRFDEQEPYRWPEFRYQQKVTDQFDELRSARANSQEEVASGAKLRGERAAGVRRRAIWKAFIPLSAAVYTMGLLDQTATISHNYWRDNEQDPLVKPFTQMPAPAFVAGGVAFETGVNWVAWRMERSRRWHRIWWLPQVCAVGANAYGYDISTHY